MPKVSHEERTAADPRGPNLYSVIVHKIDQVNEKVRLIQLRKIRPEDAIKFLPGQWLDVHIPNLRAGGFTITSSPRQADGKKGHLELAIQISPKNPPAAWFWQKKSKVEGKRLLVRVGGSFVWPPPGIDTTPIQNLVFVAGGVGVNPLVSILTTLHNNPRLLPHKLHFLYSNRSLRGAQNRILFRSRLCSLFALRPSPTRLLTFFHTPPTPFSSLDQLQMWEDEQTVLADERKGNERNIDIEQGIFERCGRMTREDLMEALGPVEERNQTLCYVCGPPQLTDWAVHELKNAEGVEDERVLCEKWW